MRKIYVIYLRVIFNKVFFSKFERVYVCCIGGGKLSIYFFYKVEVIFYWFFFLISFEVLLFIYSVKVELLFFKVELLRYEFLENFSI